MDGLLKTLKNNKHKILVYADDLVIMADGKYNTTVKVWMQESLNILTK